MPGCGQQLTNLYWALFLLLLPLLVAVATTAGGAATAGAGINVNFLRIFRAARLIKLLKKGEIKTLVWTFYRSLGNLPWVSLLILLIFYVYGERGISLPLHSDRW